MKEGNMDFFEVVRTRRSVRAYSSRPVETDKLQAILQAANLAPSAGNLQAYEIFVAQSQTVRDRLAQAAGMQEFITQAPVALVFCANPRRSAGKYGQRGATLYCLQDATIACAYAQLAAAALGLASVWVGAFEEDEVRRAIGVGADLRPVAILPLGYAAEAPGPSSRRPLRDLVHRLE
jgi:nitroreductase